jgi:hypothetical protein
MWEQDPELYGVRRSARAAPKPVQSVDVGETRYVCLLPKLTIFTKEEWDDDVSDSVDDDDSDDSYEGYDGSRKSSSRGGSQRGSVKREFLILTIVQANLKIKKAELLKVLNQNLEA